jgi:hypothetical protein
MYQPSELTYTLLEDGKIRLREGVGFSNNRNQVDPRPQTLHDLNVERLEAKRKAFRINIWGCFK